MTYMSMIRRLWHRWFGEPKVEPCRHPAAGLKETGDTPKSILYSCPCGVYIQFLSPLAKWHDFLRRQTPEVRNAIWEDREFWETANRHGLAVHYADDQHQYKNVPHKENIMVLGEPNLSEVERKRSQGVAVLYYTDGDYRCKWFTARHFTDDDDEMFDITADRVRDEYLPQMWAMLALLREEPGEPRQAGFEVYWEGLLIHQEAAPEYEPVPLEEVVADD